jgi:hypothetical protein
MNGGGLRRVVVAEEILPYAQVSEGGGWLSCI